MYDLLTRPRRLQEFDDRPDPPFLYFPHFGFPNSIFWWLLGALARTLPSVGGQCQDLREPGLSGIGPSDLFQFILLFPAFCRMLEGRRTTDSPLKLFSGAS